MGQVKGKAHWNDINSQVPFRCHRNESWVHRKRVVLALMIASGKHPLGHGPQVVYSASIYVDNFQMESDTRFLPANSVPP